MWDRYKKKIVGTGVFLLLILGAAVMASPQALARFTSVGQMANYDGIVTAVTSSSLTLDTNGTTPIVIQVTDRTRFARNSDLSDIQVGDAVFVNTRDRGSSVEAVLVRPEDEDSAYGTAGERVIVVKAVVQSKGANTFVIRTPQGTDVTFRVTPQTRFVGGADNFAELTAGMRVLVSGRDTGTEFVARTVISH